MKASNIIIGFLILIHLSFVAQAGDAFLFTGKILRDAKVVSCDERIATISHNGGVERVVISNISSNSDTTILQSIIKRRSEILFNSSFVKSHGDVPCINDTPGILESTFGRPAFCSTNGLDITQHFGVKPYLCIVSICAGQIRSIGYVHLQDEEFDIENVHTLKMTSQEIDYILRISSDGSKWDPIDLTKKAFDEKEPFRRNELVNISMEQFEWKSGKGNHSATYFRKNDMLIVFSVAMK